jgi:hypothetical protein
MKIVLPFLLVVWSVLAGCGKCKVASDCQGSFCDVSSGKCIAVCHSDRDCPQTAHCNTMIGNCVPETIRFDAQTSTTADAQAPDASGADGPQAEAGPVD